MRPPQDKLQDTAQDLAQGAAQDVARGTVLGGSRAQSTAFDAASAGVSEGVPFGAEAFGPHTPSAKGRFFRGGPFGAMTGNDADIAEALLEEDPFLSIGPAQSIKPPRLRRATMGIWLLISLPLMAFFVVFLVLAVTHMPLPAPQWLVTKIEDRINATLEAGAVKVRLAGGADLIVDEGVTPRFRLHTVELLRPSGMPIAAFPELRATIWALPLLGGKIEARSFRVSGARVVMRRLENGTVDFGFGGDWALSGGALSVEATLKQFEAVFATPALARVERIEANDLELRVDDARLGRTWWVREGRFELRQDAREIGVDLAFDAGAQNTLPAEAVLSLTLSKTGTVSQIGPQARLGLRVNGVPARDLAVQSPALGFLSVIDAPISGAIAMETEASGAMGPMRATLQLGEGALSPGGAARPLEFKGGTVRLAYDPAAARLDISEMSVDSRTIRLKATATAHLGAITSGLPENLTSQIAISDLALDPAGAFDAPARFTQGAADLRVTLDPFSVELGQLSLSNDSQNINLHGRVRALPAGWDVAMDAGLGAIDKEDFLKLWPLTFKPKDRNWLVENIAQGRLQNANAALRLTPQAEPRLALSYEFSDAQARVVKTLPLTENTRGFATVMNNQHMLMIEEGDIPAPDGSGRVDVAGSTFKVLDIRIKPPQAKIQIRSTGPLPAMLSLLDQEPFQFFKKANLPSNLAQGRAVAVTDLDLVIRKKLIREEVTFHVRADLYDVVSDIVVKGKNLTADHLKLEADDAGIAIFGKGALNGAGFDARWTQNLARAAKGKSRVTGDVEVSPKALNALGISLPKGMVSGAGRADIDLDLVAGQPPRYTLNSTLAGIGISLPQIGWNLPQKTRGTLSVSGRLGQPATVEALSISGAGFAAKGALTLTKTGMESGRFESVTIGNWFKGAVDIAGSEIKISNGRVDLRALPKSSTGGGASGLSGSKGAHISAKLDRVIVDDRLSLTGVSADLTTKGGIAGAFTAAVNGKSRIAGTLSHVQGNARPAIRVGGRDAGAVVAAAGIFPNLRGGKLDLALTPIGAMYQGHVDISDARVKDAPALASMLSAISGVGLIEQLNGEGLVFSKITGDFRVSDKAVTVTKGSAEGASLGVTMSGVYLPKTKVLDLRGVVSPFYLINGIGQVLTQRGEGLFGFNYSVKGTASAPKVSVNPLSILAPGMLRGLFRGKAPTAPE